MVGRIGAIVLILTLAAQAAELRPEAIREWDEYTWAADQHAKAQANGGSLLVPLDADQQTRLQRGEILVSPAVSRGMLQIPNALIHDWRGAIFVPNTTLKAVLAVVHDYDHYKSFYGPTVIESKALDCARQEQKFMMVWRRKVLFVNAALESEYVSRDFPVDEHNLYSITATTRIQEYENYGRDGEHLLPPNQGEGFLWRVHSIARYSERDGGVYLELEAIGLTRDIPASLGWLVKPIAARLARNGLVTALQQTRAAAAAHPILLSRTP